MKQNLPRAVVSAMSLALALFTGSATAQDDIPPSAYARVNASLLENHVLPRYETLVAATAALDAAAREFCSGSVETPPAAVRDRYHDAMDAWMAVQHIRFGPVELFMRAYRLYFWPEVRGKVAGAVDELLAGGPDALTAEALVDASVAVQGLPALEHLLYAEPDSGGAWAAGRCTLLQGITGNMSGMAEDIVAEWRGGDVDFRQLLTHPGPENVYYDSHKAATLEMFKSFHGALQVIADVKLKPVIGDGTETARPELVESRESGRALRNIVINLEALQAMYVGEGGAGLGEPVATYGGDDKLDPLMRKAFRLTIENAKSIDRPLGAIVVDPGRRARAEKLSTQVLALKQIVKTRVAKALGLAVGFNALDGD